MTNAQKEAIAAPIEARIDLQDKRTRKTRRAQARKAADRG